MAIDGIFYAQYLADGVAVTGLAVTVDVYRIVRATGAGAEIVSGAAASEAIHGGYYYRLAGVDLKTYDYYANFHTADLTVDQQDIACLWSNYVEAYAYELARIGVGRIDVVSPVAQDGDVTTVQGVDYLNADGCAIDWLEDATNPVAWPDLTGATVKILFEGTAVDLNGSVVVPAGAGKKVRVEVTAAQSLAIPAGSQKFQVIATLTNTHKIALVEGVWTSKVQV